MGVLVGTKKHMKKDGEAMAEILERLDIDTARGKREMERIVARVHIEAGDEQHPQSMETERQPDTSRGRSLVVALEVGVAVLLERLRPQLP